MDSSLLFTIATLLYLIAIVFYISYLAFQKRGIGLSATVLTTSGFAVQTIALLLRWWESYQMDIGRVPLSNLYESLVFFTWCTVLIYLFVENRYKTRFFGAFVMPVAFLALAFINVAGISSDITPLVPALKSNWLFYHVLVSFLGYAAFGVAFAVSMVYLLMDTEEQGSAVPLMFTMAGVALLVTIGYYMSSLGETLKRVFWLGFGVLVLVWFIYIVVVGAKKKSQIFLFWSLCITLAIGLLAAMGIDFIALSFQPLAAGESFKKHLFETTFLNPAIPIVVASWAVFLGLFWLVWSKAMKLKGLIKDYMPVLNQLDDVTYRMIAVGWPLLTGGIITGAVWANSAWGSYWSWDPKETWSLITWFIYAIYLHGRYVRGWKGTQMAVISAVGFLAVIFTYLGVNLVLSGLHSYGGMN
jgi:cytochrome c-type biogenesis protein CcsB